MGVFEKEEGHSGLVKVENARSLIRSPIEMKSA